MRRIVFIVAAGLIGLLLSIASSWIPTYIHTNNPQLGNPLNSPDWILPVPTDWPSKPNWTNAHYALGYSRYDSVALPLGWGIGSTVTRSGFPMRSMCTKRFSVGELFINREFDSIESHREHMRERDQAPSSYSEPDIGALAGWYLGVSSTQSFFIRNEVRLPLRVIPLGFAVNWVFWTAVVLLIGWAPGALRRRNRVSKGLCIRCKYELAGLTTCPECGTQSTPKPAA
ncbi:MAG: hypothetical protein Phyf2KO_08390 [Phycisphaerales bacterium]